MQAIIKLRLQKFRLAGLQIVFYPRFLWPKLNRFCRALPLPWVSIRVLTERNRPFLSTREAFILKDPQNQQLLNRYRQANEQERYGILRAMADLPLPAVTIFNNGPLALDVEWVMSG